MSFIYYPFLMDVGYKNEVLRVECIEEQEKEKILNLNNFLIMILENEDPLSKQFLQIEVRREYLLEDTLNQLSKGGLNFKKELRVHFIGEPGLDEGGPRKELF